VAAAAVAVGMEGESPCQAEDQNGSDLELDRIHEALLNQIHEPLVLVLDRVEG
jgi:hypothetical protein